MAKKKTTSRTLQAQATRKKIFDTAMSLFNEHGYGDVTVDEICEATSVSKGTFYHYFASKDQVIMEFFMTNDSYYQEAFEEISKMESRIDQLVAFGKAVVDYIVNELGLSMMKPIYCSQVAPGSGKSPMLSESRSLYVVIEKMVREGQERGEIRRDVSSDDITELITVLFRGLVFEWCLSDGELDIERLSGIMILVLLDSLRVGD